MVVGGSIPYAKAHRDRVEEGALPEVLADVKQELIAAGAQLVAFQERLVGAAVLIGRHGLQELPRLSLQHRELDLHPRARPAVRRIQHVGGYPSHHPSPKSFARRPRVMWPICSSAAASSASALLPRRRSISATTLVRFACRRRATMQGKPNFSR